MPAISLRYGKEFLDFEFRDGQFDVLSGTTAAAPLTDAELGARIDAPIGSKPLEEIVAAGESVLIVVPDATRQTACGQIVNLLVRRLIANGTMPYDIRIIFATGIHRAVTDAEKRELLTPFIHQRISTLDHRAKDLMLAAGLGSDRFIAFEPINGEPVELNRALVEHDRVILVGGVSFHYFAGFTGGRKLICPGLASAKTISATHKLAFDFDRRTRRDGVGPAKLSGNPVHEAFVQAARNIDISFAVNTITNEKGEATEVFCGDWLESHRAGCDFFERQNSVVIDAKRDVVVVSTGGSPYDINMIQAHKALEAASHACRDGGTIVLVAECPDGTGRRDFLDWFAEEDSAAVATRLCENYQVNGQTAWALLSKAERFDVKIVTSLAEEETRRMRLHKARDLNEIVFGPEKTGFIIPNGAKCLIKSASG